MPRPAFDVIVTERLLLRRFRPDDAPSLAAYRNDPDIARYQAWGTPYTLQQAHDLIGAMQDRHPGQPGWFQFAVAARSDGRLIGDLGLRAFEVRHGEIGFTFARNVHGHGYATEAVTALLHFAFEALELHRVIAATDPRNEKSSTLLRRLGFRHEGRFQESYFDGTAWLDDDHYALLAREWPLRDS